MADTPASAEEYLAALPDAVRERLEEVRHIVRETLPGSGETISYRIPMVTLDGRGLSTTPAGRSI